MEIVMKSLKKSFKTSYNKRCFIIICYIIQNMLGKFRLIILICSETNWILQCIELI